MIQSQVVAVTMDIVDIMMTRILTKMYTSMQWVTRSQIRLISMPSNTGENKRRGKIRKIKYRDQIVATSMISRELLSFTSCMEMIIWHWLTLQKIQEFCKLGIEAQKRGRSKNSLDQKSDLVNSQIKSKILRLKQTNISC